MNKFNRKSFWTVAGGVFTLGLIFWAVRFLYSEINDTSKIIGDASMNVALLQEKEREFEASSLNLQKYSVETENLDKVFLREDTFVDLLRLFEELAADAGVKFKAISAKVPSAADDKASLSFELEGQQVPLVRFFVLLDHIPYSGVVDNMNWSQQGKSSDDIKVGADFIIFNYAK